MPGEPENWLVLGNALTVLGELEEAAAVLREAVRTLPFVPEFRLLLAMPLTALDLHDEALSHVEAVLEAAPDHAKARFLRLEILANLRRWDEVDAASDPSTDPRLMQQYARSLTAEDALALYDRQLAVNPAHTNAIYLKAVALAGQGRAGEANKLIALDRHLSISALPAPPGYDDGEVFREALVREIRANPTLLGDPKGKPLRDGLRTSRLSRPDAVAVEALLGQIRKAVDAYIGKLEASGDEFVGGRPKSASLKSWAVIYGREGRQKSHRHPGGWLSGVYFASAPRPAGENAYRGPLLVGALDPELGVDPPWGVREVEPVPGRLVLFPSYVPHATEPTGIEGARVSVAFDVVPASG